MALSKEAQLEWIFDVRPYDMKGGVLVPHFQITVTADEVIAYIKENGIPDWFRVHTQPGPADGTYLIQRGKEWISYSQERGARYGDETIYPTYDDALQAFVVWQLKDCLK